MSENKKCYKIKRVQFLKHDILGNLDLDFSDDNGVPLDTIIFAGENGTGKSTILNCLYKLTARNNIYPDFDCILYLFDINSQEEVILTFERDQNKTLWVTDSNTNKKSPISAEFVQKYPFTAIYSDVDIIFNSDDVSSITSTDIDIHSKSQRSSQNLAKQTKQLLVDVKAIDSEELEQEFTLCKNRGEDTNSIQANKRMSRFTNAFDFMFKNIRFRGIENKAQKKQVIFVKNGVPITIDALSSGEKQIVFRDCFLLKDKNALKGAFVYIDEPEISLHPEWQKKVLENYKRIFTDENGIQTSQIFTVTHSPFIIHNEWRRNDKVIVLKLDETGLIRVSDKTEYYKCNSIEAVEDAFQIKDFHASTSKVYLAGRTDNKYFDRALEVYGYTDVPFEFKWIGYIDGRGQEVNTGDKNLDRAYHFLVSQNLNIPNICLYDCDTNKTESKKNQVYMRLIPAYNGTPCMEKGIENALVLKDIDISTCYITSEKIGSYGDAVTTKSFDKMKCCDLICGLDSEQLKPVLQNLKIEIDKLVDICTGG